jgi:D-arabinose 1-dehydrogenase-like Zn-dependent alcohol dehydrogenase
MTTVNAYAANEAGGKLKPFKYELPKLGSDQVDIKVLYCGICHSDLSMLNNEWGMSQYPFVPGHEVVSEVVAFSSNPDKKDQILAMGATKVINFKDPKELDGTKGSLDFVMNTTNANLVWNSYLSTLAPKGRFHTVGAVLEPVAIPGFLLIVGEKSVAGSPTGSPAPTQTKLGFCVRRHNIYPIVEQFLLAKVN